MKGTSKATRFLGIVLLAGILLAGLLYVRKGVLIDNSGLCGGFESCVDEILSKNGVSDSQVRKVIRQERKKKFPIPTSWIETEREIILPPGLQVTVLIEEIKDAAQKSKLNSFFEDFREDRVVLECGRRGQVFQRLIFLGAFGKMAGKYRVAIVIDDVAGRLSDSKTIEQFFSLGIPVTYAVLPMEKLSGALAEKIHRFGDEVIVHQPMEPEDMANNDPGKAALMVKMSLDDINKKLAKNVKSVPYAVGVSNHMGSRFTSDVQAMSLFCRALKGLDIKQGRNPLFFLDSHTSPKIVGKEIARKMVLGYLANDIFLDNVDALEPSSKQMELLKQAVKKKKCAVAIGHIQKKFTADAIRRAIPEFKKEGIEFVHLSELIYGAYSAVSDKKVSKPVRASNKRSGALRKKKVSGKPL